MSLSKTEQEHFHLMRQMLSFRRTDPGLMPEAINLEAAIPKMGPDRFIDAWTFSPAGTVFTGHTDGHRHAVGSNKGDPSATYQQGPGGPWFWTRLDALMALRVSMETSMSGLLFKMDEAIAHERVAAKKPKSSIIMPKKGLI